MIEISTINGLSSRDQQNWKMLVLPALIVDRLVLGSIFNMPFIGPLVLTVSHSVVCFGRIMWVIMHRMPKSCNMNLVKRGWGKPNSPVLLYFWFFNIVFTRVSNWIWQLYLTGVAAAQLRWHLSKISASKKNLIGVFFRSKMLLRVILTNGA